MPEPTPEDSAARAAGYETIADITRERVRRVIAKMEADAAGRLPDPDKAAPDLGFRAFKLTASHFKLWDGDIEPGDTEALDTSLTLFSDNRNPDADNEAMLFEILLKAGYPLSVAITTRTAADSGQPYYAIGDGSLLICLADTIEADTLRAMIADAPTKIVCLDAAFAGNDALKTNMMLEARAAGVTLETL